MDAIKIGSKVYHGTCYAELKKDGAITPLRTPTPESVLGKRKAGVSLMTSLVFGGDLLIFSVCR